MISRKIAKKNLSLICILVILAFFTVHVSAVNLEADADILALFDAVFEDDIPKVNQLLKDGVDPNGRDAFNRTPLLFAALGGSEKTIPLLIEAGADINAVANNKLQTPLIAAVDAGYLHIVKMLINAGANTDTRDTLGRTAVWYAVFLEDKKSLALLLEAGANPNIWDKYMQMPLMEAAHAGFPDMVAMLLEAGADPNVTNFKDWTALMIAADRGFYDVVEILIKAGADVNLINNRGKTALFLSDRWNYTKLSNIIKEVGGTY